MLCSEAAFQKCSVKKMLKNFAIFTGTLLHRDHNTIVFQLFFTVVANQMTGFLYEMQQWVEMGYIMNSFLQLTAFLPFNSLLSKALFLLSASYSTSTIFIVNLK